MSVPYLIITGLVVMNAVAIALATVALVQIHHQLGHQRTELRSVQAFVVHEKICTAHNVGGACRALFDRVEPALTRAQRKRLFCDALSAVQHDPLIDDVKRRIKCP